MSPRSSAAASTIVRGSLASNGRAWTATLVVLIPIYLLSAHWQTAQVTDSLAAAWPAWQFGQTGSFDLSGVDDLPALMWFSEVDGRVVSDRMMGVILAGVPLSVLLRDVGLNAMQIGALTAALMTAVAMANMHVVLRRTVPRAAAAGVLLVLALGTPLWTTASSELWTHGPNVLWLSCALLALTSGRYALAGAALAFAIMTRPHLAVAAAVIGVYLAWHTRRPSLLLKLGLPSSLGVPALLLWNHWYLRAGSLAGGTYEGRSANATAAPDAAALLTLLQDVAGTFLSPRMGLFLFTPVLLMLLPHARSAWRDAPPWARAALLAGVAYQFVQWRLNRYNGGTDFYGNRLICEALVLSAPLWALMAVRACALRGRALRVTLLAGVSVALHVLGAFSQAYYVGHEMTWNSWYPFIIMSEFDVFLFPLILASLLMPALAIALFHVVNGNGARGAEGVFSLSSTPEAARLSSGREPRTSPLPEQRSPSSDAPAPLPGAAASTRR